MLEHGWPVTHQMLAVPDGAPLGPAEQSGEPPLAVDQRQVAQVVAVMLDQVEREQHRLMAPASAPQRMEVRRPVVAGNHGLAVDQERRSLDAACSVDDGRETVGPGVKQRTRGPSRRTINRYPSCLISWGQSGP